MNLRNTRRAQALLRLATAAEAPKPELMRLQVNALNAARGLANWARRRVPALRYEIRPAEYSKDPEFVALRQKWSSK